MKEQGSSTNQEVLKLIHGWILEDQRTEIEDAKTDMIRIFTSLALIPILYFVVAAIVCKNS